MNKSNEYGLFNHEYSALYLHLPLSKQLLVSASLKMKHINDTTILHEYIKECLTMEVDRYNKQKKDQQEQRDQRKSNNIIDGKYCLRTDADNIMKRIDELTYDNIELKNNISTLISDNVELMSKLTILSDQISGLTYIIGSINDRINHHVNTANDHM